MTATPVCDCGHRHWATCTACGCGDVPAGDDDFTDWRDQAACRGHDPELWFPDPGETFKRREAIAICDTCPVLTPCAIEAHNKHIPHGIWGGQTAKQRSQIRGVRADRLATINRANTGRPRQTSVECGTHQGYKRHHHRNEPACAPCRDAHAKHMRHKRAEQRRARA